MGFGVGWWVVSVYGRQELPEQPGSDPQDYLRLLAARSVSSRLREVEVMGYTQVRWLMFSVMVAVPEREWTVKALALALMPAGEAADPAVVVARAHAVRDTLNVLMADGLVEPVPYQRAFTVRLTKAGVTHLRDVLLCWSERHRAGSGGG